MSNETEAPAALTLTCPQLLSALRKAAHKRQAWTDRACAVLERGGGTFAVESYEGRIVWEGVAHCTFCARIKAICVVANAADAREIIEQPNSNENKKKVFGEYFDEAMQKRMLRDSIASVRRAIVDRGRYAQRGYIVGATEDSVHFYHMRRDGRVGRSWGPISLRHVHEIGEELKQL
jgi:hypothetical protein